MTAVFILSLMSISKAWIGHAKVEVEFIVSDLATGDPIPGATISVKPTDGPPPADSPDVFELVTDSRGRAVRLRPDNVIAGRDEKGHLYPPDWEVIVRADGFQDSDPIHAWNVASWRRVIKPNGQTVAVPMNIGLYPAEE